MTVTTIILVTIVLVIVIKKYKKQFYFKRRKSHDLSFDGFDLGTGIIRIYTNQFIRYDNSYFIFLDDN